uniref:Uncharacterized protein n=1 Tax=Gibberella zeae TaxID=5518 RepID=A0A4E9EJF5_GIBZA
MNAAVILNTEVKVNVLQSFAFRKGGEFTGLDDVSEKQGILIAGQGMDHDLQPPLSGRIGTVFPTL